MNHKTKQIQIILPFTLLFLTLLLTFSSFYPALNHQITNWDDNFHLTDNPQVQSLSIANLNRIFHSLVYKVYIPLSTLSFALEYHFFKLNPFIYHLDNLLLHLIVVALIFILAQRLGLSVWAASLSAGIFGIHPMHVESVAWITERKDVLYSVFYLTAVLCYWDFISKKKKIFYVFSLLAGILSILSKPMALSLPLILLLLDWMHKRKFSLSDITSKIPYLIFIIPLTLITYIQHARIPGISFPEALIIWIWSFSFYIQKFFLPLQLIPLYFLPEPVNLTNPSYWGGLIIFLISLIIIFRFRKSPWPVISFGFYFLSIFFLLRYDKNIDLNIVADRFMYLPSLGFCLLLGRGFDFVSYHFAKNKFGLNSFFLIILILLFILHQKTYSQSLIWKDSLTLLTNIIQSYPDPYKYPGLTFIFTNRGAYYLENQDFVKALKDFNTSLEINPDNISTLNNRGVMFYRFKKYDSALADFEKSYALDPKSPVVPYNKSLIYFAKGEYDFALIACEQTISNDPSYPKIYLQRGKIYYQQGKYDLALLDINQEIDSNPNSIDAYLLRADLFQKLGEHEKAKADTTQALSLDDNNAKANHKMALSLISLNQLDSALDYFNKAIALSPDSAEFYNNRGILYLQKKELKLALDDFNKALTLNPQYIDALISRGTILSDLKDTDAAFKEYSKVVELDPKNWKAYNNRANIFTARKEFESALKDLDKAIEYNPQAWETYNNRGFLYKNLGKYELAVTDFSQCLTINNGNLLCSINRGGIYLQLAQYDLALNDFNTVIQKDPSNLAGYYYRSLIYNSMHRYQEALDDAQKAESLGYKFTNNYIENLKTQP